jgi:DNA-binding NtrC family response regulator/tetratricopeptide (TPR) repeat protein
MHPPLRHPRYEAREVLGRGAQGVVVRVVDREAPERALVAKVWSGRANADALQAELELLLRVRAPGLVRAHDLGRDAETGAPFFVEDFVDGPDARAWVASAPERERTARLTDLVVDVARTLGALHEAGYVHGDVKPAHVRVRADGRPVLLDLGAATALGGAERGAAYTPGYAAPEIVAGGAPSPRSDLYALGATAWAAATGEPPRATRSPKLRERAPWIPPSLADVVEALVATHPLDRPASVVDLFARLGRDASLGARESGGAAARREELATLAALGPGVFYVTGPSGVGKSHLARELFASALLAGRDARMLRFPCEHDGELRRVMALLRDEDAGALDPSRAPLVILDDLHAAPEDARKALEVRRCRGLARATVTFVATARDAPEGAEAIPLSPLDARAFTALCDELGVSDAREIERLRRESGAIPGWVAAALGRVPLDPESARARLADLPAGSRSLLASIAIAGGRLPDPVVARIAADDAIRPLVRAALVRRTLDPPGLTLSSPPLASDLARSLSTFEVVDRLADALLDGDAAPSALLAAAGAPNPPSRRTELLARAAAAAREEGVRDGEIEALLGLCADPKERTSERLVRLERLTRDTGRVTAHPQVLAWLDEAARADPALVPLARRRSAEKAARAGDHEAAARLVEEARLAARDRGDTAQEVWAASTRGALALYRGDWVQADRALADARARLADLDAPDTEELARLHHNLGVVALYRGRLAEAIAALERSLEAKRALDDAAGVRSCMLNLGLALAKAGRHDEAARALEGATALARSLGQRAGVGWCLAARADLEVRRADPEAAARFTAEAESLGDALPAPVRSDLALLRAEIALLDGDGRGALGALATLDAATRAADPLVFGRTLVIEARAKLCTLPAAPRAAARLAIRAARHARREALPEIESAALEALRAARATRKMRYEDPPMAASDDKAFAALERVAEGAPLADCAHALARALVAEARAERAFVAFLDPSGLPVEAFGVDVDGLPLGDAARRIPTELVEAALRRERLVYARDVATSGGTGSRLAVAGGARRAAIVLEHRFAPRCFDHVTEPQAARWATLASVLARLGASAESPAAPRAAEPAPEISRESSTSFPVSAPRRAYPTILGASPALARAVAKLDAAVDTNLPVLLTGETGVGKEVFARALHESGRRARAPFVAVNCAAIPDSLFEAELFGHARGSFTGADRARGGLIARAEAGTLFLDEIGELPLARQATLLRVLETRRYRPVGSDDERPFDVRVVTATNRDLAGMVKAGSFRQDLLYRLQVLEVRIPPLRERAEDVPVLARHFLERAGGAAALSRAAMAALMAYAWPGNVRELEHAMQRLAALRLPAIDVEHLPREIRAAAGAARGSAKSALEDPRDEVARALATTGGNISQAAELLGLTRHGLKKRMLRLGMRAPGVAAKKGAAR